MPEIGIVIVTCNSQAVIGESLDAAVGTGAEIVVVDNASVDGTMAAVARRGVRLIANPTNRGFAAAVNQGIRALQAPFVLLLNPDATLQGGLEALREACDLPRVAGAGGLLLGADGRPQAGFMARRLPTPGSLILELLLLNRLWPANPVNRQYRGLDWDYTVEHDVEQPAGAFLMVRRDVWTGLGGFDERYFPLWFEDVDFCRRAIDRGYRLRFTPRAVANYTGGHSVSALALETRNIYWYCNLLRYSARHFGPLAFRVVCLAVVTGSCLRVIAESALRRSLKPLAAYRRTMGLAARCLVVGRQSKALCSGPLFQH